MSLFYVANLLVSTQIWQHYDFSNHIQLLKPEMLNQSIEVIYKAQIIPLEHAFDILSLLMQIFLDLSYYRGVVRTAVSITRRSYEFN